jgi:serine phosphatase RsbU (regulator of sigma subunit)/pSer/pThr/pTyr-binding forkhead associated (FHA) protein
MSLPSNDVLFPEPPDSFPCVLVVRGAMQSVLRLQHLPITIGRKAEKDICIADSRMSRDHAAIVGEDGQFFIEDQNSKLGTFLNGVQVIGRKKISANDRIDFGHGDLGYIVFSPEKTAVEPPKSRTEPDTRELLTQIIEQQPGGAASDLERLSLFLEAARKLNTSRVLDEILITLVEATLRLTKAERGFVFLYDRNGKLRLAAGLDERGRTLREDSTISHSTLMKAVTSACEFLITDTSSSAELAQQLSIMNFELRTVICIPLLRRPDGSGQLVSGALYLDSQQISRDLSAVSNDLLRTIAREAAALVENAELVQEQESTRRYEQELSIAGVIQQQLMTVKIPGSSFAQVQARNIPCKEIGGDFFDVIATDDSISAVLADVCGKGVSAALLASILQGMIYAQLKASVPLAEIADVANRFLCQKDIGEKYATLTIARLNPSGLLEFMNCGHVPPFLVQNGTLARTKPLNPPVGLIDGLSYTTETYQLAPGDRLVVFTDGITEAQDAAEEFFGDERLYEAVAANSFEEIFARVQKFCGETPLNDDCTVLELQYKG